MQEVDAEEIGHEGQLRVEMQDGGYGGRGGNGVGGAGVEARGGNPVWIWRVVVEHGDGVPFTVKEDVQDVEDQGAVREDQQGACVGFGRGSRS